VRVALIGAGAIARRHIEILGRREDVTITAVCDTREERAGETARAVGARPYAHWEAMLDSEPLDAVFVCTPPEAHAAPTISALERHVSVYVEKPLARSAGDGLAIVSAWESVEAVCAVGYQWRSLDLLENLRSVLGGDVPGLLVSRSFGPTEAARGDLAVSAPEWSWFADPERSGGILFELGSHDIDLQLAVAGPVESVQAVAASGLLALAGKPASGLDDAVSLLLHFSGGGIGAVTVGWSAATTKPLYALDVLTSNATLQLELDPSFRLHGRAHGRELDVSGAVDPRVSSVDRFLAAVERGERNAVACAPPDAFGTLETALACERALATGRAIQVR
jgi:myo-inositol 2-dehydrogenase / D-chiro-inositol 1-dehydrogenase